MMAQSMLFIVLFTGAAALSVLQDPPSLDLQEGQTALMFCTLGEPQSNWDSVYFSWRVNSTAIHPSSRVTITSGPRSLSSSLRISPVTARDSGLYECEIWGMNNYIVGEPYTGNGTRLLVAAYPVITLMMDKEKQLLICEAQRFYPPELNISWSFSNMENQTQDTLVENADGTYTKRSTVGIADIMREREVTCSLQHISLTAPLNDTLYVSGAAALRVLQDPPSLDLREGQTALMFCTLGGPQRDWDSVYFYWKVNSTGIHPSSRVTITSGPRSLSSSLRISPVTARDSGLYECEIRALQNHIQESRTGNGTRLLVAAFPVITLMMDKEKQLLICEAQRFYPPELNISWSFSNMENQTQDTLVENADGTYTKSSTVGIADIMREREVTCSLQHISLTAPLNDTLYVSGKFWVQTETPIYTERGTRLPVTAFPVITLMMDKEKQLLICEAQRFYPPELNISWSFSNTKNQTQDTLVENADGTYTKRSTVGIADIMREREVTCSLQHISLTAPLNETLYVSAHGSSLYQQLFPVRILLTLILVLSPCICNLYIHCAM
ncbi:signal-regulatory protein gamma-like [Spea bombifrons]|uniref:signal-regulatory protein gamma-like n=1 Tax=Spea bombifrons TaxID=233779 RepID=UPI00234B0D20|nr:signal-regulatory protein gamma-like [Spea bombifrons]